MQFICYQAKIIVDTIIFISIVLTLSINLYYLFWKQMVILAVYSDMETHISIRLSKLWDSSHDVEWHKLLFMPCNFPVVYHLIA